ncbi:hypothetical protein Sjap_000619 [Stephania japonica]|uniref:Uncharacterized protein n=1 Tax=Stephania japonica TaxID=461633 RepID=A0AAP0KK77_9MAGN
MQKHGFSTDCLFAICELLKSTPKIETFVLRRIENQWFCEPLNWDEDISSLSWIIIIRLISHTHNISWLDRTIWGKCRPTRD